MSQNPVRLTQIVAAAGCAAKLGPLDLARAVAQLRPVVDPRLLVGTETLDDAAVVAVRDDLALVLTTDFITPVVDDPADWGWIAAANAISDVYAMGGTPLAALNLVAWPAELGGELLGQVLQGGAGAAAEAGCLVVGGHSVEDAQPKFGLAVLGTIHPQRIVRNQGARPGDALFLTKALGTGTISTAIKAELAEPPHVAAAVASMKTLNRAACEAALAAGVHAMTDVTGFSLIGHLSEMLGPAGTLGAELRADRLPWLPGVRDYLAMGLAPRGTYRNREAYQSRVDLQVHDELLELLLFDPQTSGGLLIAAPPAGAERLRSAAQTVSYHEIGRITASGRIVVL